MLWGFVPLFFLLLVPISAAEIVGWRVLFSLAFCLILVALRRGWRDIVAIIRQPRLLGMVALAALIIYGNWFLFTFASTNGYVLETSLGFFITPIVTVVLGVFVLGERLRPLQWIAFGLTAVAVVVLSVLYGQVPWIALALAVSFGVYGFIKKRIGARVDAVSGLALETAIVVPIAVIQLIVIGVTTGLAWPGIGGLPGWLLPLSGVATILPLLLFAAGTRRVPLIYIGMLQFIEPLLQFLTGTFLLHEPLPPDRLLGFGIVWLGVALLIADSLIALGGRARDRRRAPVIPPTQATGPLRRIETAEIRLPRERKR